MGGTEIMAGRRLRTAKRNERAREKFWNEHGEKVRLTLIGGSVLLISVVIANLAFGG